MMARVMNDERARQTARRARRCYAWVSAVWMLAMAGFGIWLVLR